MDTKNREHRKRTSMAAFFWSKKNKNIDINAVRYKIVNKCRKYTPGAKACDVCLKVRHGSQIDKNHHF